MAVKFLNSITLPVGTPATGKVWTATDTVGNAAWSLNSAIARSINVISTSGNAGSAANTDYVYLVSSTTTLTLPTAIGNVNRYTVKNVGVNIVTIATSLSQTIDGSTSAVLSVQYIALDIVSDGSNWNVM